MTSIHSSVPHAVKVFLEKASWIEDRKATRADQGMQENAVASDAQGNRVNRIHLAKKYREESIEIWWMFSRHLYPLS